MRPLRASLAAITFALPLALLAACGVDGKTPDCAAPNAGCEPSADNRNPDARPADATTDAPAKDGGGEAATPDAGADADAASDAKLDAKLDADAKG